MSSTSSIRESFQQFAGKQPDCMARAPGRIEFIGNHTDYNGGDVLGAALNLYITVAGRRRNDRKIRLATAFAEGVVEVDLDSVQPQRAGSAWANYPLGVLHVLRESGISIESGMDLYFVSDLPAGAGLSSSAAIELATVEVLAALFGFELKKKERVLLAQKAENMFVGVPCGMLDQAVSCFGRQNHLVHICCSEVQFRPVSIPTDWHFWIFNTNLKHSLVDSYYAERHRECREALSRIREVHPEVEHLALADPQLVQTLSSEWPEKIRRRARHILGEQYRVKICLDALRSGDYSAVGDALFASHQSSQEEFANSTAALDALVDSLRGVSGVVGARLTGGGFGGAVMALTDESFGEQQATQVLNRYRQLMPDAPRPTVIHAETGDGACVVG